MAGLESGISPKISKLNFLAGGGGIGNFQTLFDGFPLCW
jgi:hypothetical protein